MNESAKTIKACQSSDDIYAQDIRVFEKLNALNTKEKIENFLLNQNLKDYNNIPISLIAGPISVLCVKTFDNYGLRLLFSTYIKSFSLIGDFLCHEPTVKEPKTNDKYAKMAVDLLLQTPLPPLFYPDMNEQSRYKIEVPDIFIPILPTAFACSETNIYVGIEGPSVVIIPIQNTSDSKTEVIPIENFPNEPFSILFMNDSLIFSSKTVRALHFDTKTKEQFPINLFYPFNFLYILEKKNAFEPPIVSDGEKFYSIDFGPSPKIKIFHLDLDSIMYETSVHLKEGHNPLMAPFTELLPLDQKNKALIATNGVYISFILKSPQLTICRIFLVYDGTHLHDVVLKDFDDFNGWCFNSNRPAHCLLGKYNVLMVDGCFSLPTWMTGYSIPEGVPEIKSRKNDDILIGYSHALAIFASRIIGVEVGLKLNFLNEIYNTPLEKAVLSFIIQAYNFTEDALALEAEGYKDAAYIKRVADAYKVAAKAFLVFLSLKIHQDSTSVQVTPLLDQFLICIDNEKYSYIKDLIVYIIFSCLDVFVLANMEKTSKILKTLIDSQKYTAMLFKWFPKSKYVSRALTIESVVSLCNMSLKTHYVFDDMSLPLLKSLQYGFITDLIGDKNDEIVKHSLQLSSIYLIEVVNQLKVDFDNLCSENWSLQRFTNSISFLIFDDLMKLVCANYKDFICNVQIIEIFFTVGEMQILNEDQYYVISKLFARSYYLALILSFNLIKREKCFMNFGERPKITGEYSLFENSIHPTKCDNVPGDIYENILKAAYNSYRCGMKPNEIEEAINYILSKVNRSEIPLETIRKRLEDVQQYLPQSFHCVIAYLDGENVNIVTEKSTNKYYSWFLNRLSTYYSQETVKIKVILAFFISKFVEIIPMLASVPISTLDKFVSTIDLWPYLHHEFLRLSRINFQINFNKFTPEQIEYIFPTMLAISDKLSDQSYILNTFKDSASQSFLNLAEENQMKSFLMKLRIFVKCQKTIGNCSDDFFNLAKKLMYYGNYDHLTLFTDILQELVDSGYDDRRIFDYLFYLIEEFVTMKTFLIASDGGVFCSFQSLFLLTNSVKKMAKTSEFVRRLLIELLNTDKKDAFFVIFSSVDLPRPNMEISFLENGLKYNGILRKLNKDGFSVFVKDKVKNIDKKYFKTIKILNQEKFDPEIFVNNFSEIYLSFNKYLTDFDNHKMQSLTCFYLSSLTTFSSSNEFTDKIQNDFVYKVYKYLTPQNLMKKDSDFELFYFISEMLDTDWPFFTLLNRLPQNSKQETSGARSLDLTLFRSREMKKSVENFVVALASDMLYVSSPFSCHFTSTLKLTVSEKKTMELSLNMIDKYSNTVFTTKPFLVKGEVTILTKPLEQSVYVKTGNDVKKFSIVKSSNSAFITLNLPSASVLNYQFTSLNDYTEFDKLSDGIFLTKSDKIQLPFINSSNIIYSDILRLTSIYSSKLTIKCLSKICEKLKIDDVKFLSEFSEYYLLLLPHDSNRKMVLSDDGTMSNIYKNVSDNKDGFCKAIIEFISQKFQETKQNLIMFNLRSNYSSPDSTNLEENIYESTITLDSMIKNSSSLIGFVLGNDDSEYSKQLLEILTNLRM
ncbi:F-box domain containing protein [Trichomonas vaginalis G3]|uniref:F-box domain containing protein n=1 Tax=Trichomonas vaginalis (strain ATCC PRA-98 / G3) TaxID=412133 RepID=A2G5N2_TRIV3|nr:hypothetical protein TVAGG3_1038660 [Trichomonas vaginalis G3]EAX87539.1 F-box domain containing protein [Trichomonas vaginalis G3]KAI5493389.1 hypothetical protein TVAGG3_1038660 [Trichomonas vaginalis G3]|eukprot:XP_001300469.1 F-box domain containing protein [Trichomonas vaginalis G3]